MSDTKFTKGPWDWSSMEGKGGKLWGRAGNLVFDYGSYDGMWFATYEPETDAANAALISAAPDMFDALEDAIAAMTAETIGTTRMDDPAWYAQLWAATAKARAALAKARGQS
jgi:hypothetical protein